MSEISKRLVVASDLEKDLILKNLLKTEQPIVLEIDGQSCPGLVKRYDSGNILLHMQTPVPGDMGGVERAHFIFHNSYHYFNTTALRKDENAILLPMPEKIYKNMLRAHDRVDVRDQVYMKFRILVSSERQDLANSTRLDERILIQEVAKPEPAVERMLAAIRRLVADFAQNFKVKIFKEGEQYSLDERIIRESGRIFLIYDSFEDSIEGRRRFEQDVMGIGDAYDFLLRSGETRKSAESILLDLLQQKRNALVFSESLVPLKLEGEVVGYIRLHNDSEHQRSIKPVHVLRAAKYGEALVEALVKYDYFTLQSGDQFDVPVVNLSAGGLLFKLDGSALKQYLILRTTLMMTIQTASRLIRANGMIHRIDRLRSEFGVKFFVINDEDSHFIDDVVHGRAML
jgi:hypothetical protein